MELSIKPALASSFTAPTPRRLNVLQIIGNGIVGGMESCVLRLVQHLPREQFNVTAMCPFDCAFADELRALGIEVLITPMHDDPSWSSIQTTCALVESRAIDVLHAHLPPAHLLAGLVGRLTDRPVLTTIHGRQLQTFDLEIHRVVGSHIQVVCNHSHLQALGVGVAPARLSCIPNGVDTNVFRPGPARTGALVTTVRGLSDAGAGAGAGVGAEVDADRDADVDANATASAGDAPRTLRSELGIAPEAPLVGFVGRLSPEKGPDVFARAALLLRGMVPSARCVIVGDGPMRASIEAFIERFGLSDCLRLAGTRSDMPAVYRELDLVVSTSHSEAMPLALMEAMASGLPVVATRVGGVPDLIEQDRSGWLVDPGNFEGVADRIAHILGTPGERERMGARGRERAVGRLSLADSVRRTGQLLARLAETADLSRAAGPADAISEPTMARPPLPERVVNGNGRRRSATALARAAARSAAVDGAT